MSFWNENNYKVTVAEFCERFVGHNNLVRLFTEKRVVNEERNEFQYTIKWRGMDWQIAEDYPQSDYYRVHPDVEPCPYSTANVVKVTSVGLSGEFGDEVSLVIEEK